MTSIERAANRLAEAMLLTHKWMNPTAQRADCTEQEVDLRLVYHHIHTALKDLVDEHHGKEPGE